MKRLFAVALLSLLACSKGKASAEATTSPASAGSEASEPEVPMDPGKRPSGSRRRKGTPRS